MSGTFARVWLVRLKDVQGQDDDKVFALKILRKTDGTDGSFDVAKATPLTSLSQ
jgi:hypothetical protein